MTKAELECACVARLLAALGAPATEIRSEDPPRPDVLVTRSGGERLAFEVTFLHPDEAPGSGSSLRAEVEQDARQHPSSSKSWWLPPEFMRALEYRIKEKVGKARDYELAPGETLCLLISACLALPTALAATFVFAHVVDVAALNAQFNELLERSRFDSACVHLQVGGNAVFEWRCGHGWRVRREAYDISRAGREGMAMVKELGGFRPNGLLPGTEILGRWP